MAESTLTHQWSKIQTVVQEFLGGDVAPTVTDVLSSGYRMFLWPATVGLRHDWSFLHPVATLVLRAEATDTLGATPDDPTTNTTITPTTIASYHVGDELKIGDELLKVGTVGVSTLTVTRGYRSSTAESLAADDVITILGGNATLPDDFGGLRKGFTFDRGEGKWPIQRTSVAHIIELIQRFAETGDPRLFAIAPLPFTGTTGQRWEALFHPSSDEARILYYQYDVVPAIPNVTGTVYPLGGGQHNETLIACCLAMAELRHRFTKGPQWETAMTMLAASIERDRRDAAPDTLGRLVDPSSARAEGVHVETSSLSYGGTLLE